MMIGNLMGGDGKETCRHTESRFPPGCKRLNIYLFYYHFNFLSMSLFVSCARKMPLATIFASAFH